jgi:hypothetical protein
MDEGRVIETGTHAELVRRRGRYYDLFRWQLGDRAGSEPAAPPRRRLGDLAHASD